VHTVDTTIGDGADIRATLTDARRLSNRAREVIDQVGGRAVRVASKAEGLLDSAGEMMETGQGGMTTTFTRVDTLLATVSEILEKVREGEGTIGALLTDREIYDDAREMMRDLKRHPWKFLWKE
jgi:phospholipid/cholesterol/gamma-HCH transport system substrate-binding protein